MSKATTVKEVLIAARWILEHVGFTRGATARDKYGEPVACGSPHAVCYCSLGAINRVNAHLELINGADDVLSNTPINSTACRWPPSIIKYNDSLARGKRQVVARFTRAIKRLEAQGE